MSEVVLWPWMIGSVEVDLKLSAEVGGGEGGGGARVAGWLASRCKAPRLFWNLLMSPWRRSAALLRMYTVL